MYNEVYSLLAFSPIFVAGILLIGLRIPAKYAMPITFVLTFLIAYYFWGVKR